MNIDKKSHERLSMGAYPRLYLPKEQKLSLFKNSSTHMLPVVNRKILQYLQEKREKNREFQHNEAITSTQPEENLEVTNIRCPRVTDVNEPIESVMQKLQTVNQSVYLC